MSAYVVHKKHIDALLTAGLEMVSRRYGPLRWFAPATAWRQTHERGQPWGPEAIEESQDRSRQLTRETAGQVGAMLWAENERSVNHRYDENEIEEPYIFERYRKPLREVDVFSAIACFEYQSCEHEDWHDSEAHAFCAALRKAMIDRLPGYDDTRWEITD